MAILSKGCNPDNFRLHNSLNLSFTNIWCFHSNFVDCESLLGSNSSDILPLCDTNLDDSMILALSLWEVIFFNPKGFYYSFAWSCNLRKGKTSICTGLTLENSTDSYLCLTGFSLLSVLLLFPLSITFIFVHGFWFYFIWHRSGSLNQPMLSLPLETLTSAIRTGITYSDGTDRPGELCYSFSISQKLSQMVKFPT